MSENGLFINGQWKAGKGTSFSSLNPANGEIIWQSCSANKTDVDEAISAARTAFETWCLIDLNKRLSYLKKFQDLLKENKEKLAQIIAQETGKTLWDCTGEVGAMIGKLDISLSAYEERTGTKEKELSGFKAVTRHKPHGVLVVFGPYNFPGHLPNGHILPALIAGNTIVLKPSELTPLVSEYIVSLWEQTGIPKGVINMVQGARETGEALAQHEGINGLLFTGSSTTGKILHKQFGGQTGKLLALEMGGNNPLIIDDVDDLDAAAYNTVLSAFMSSGQRCTCARRLMVYKGQTGDEFLEKLVGMDSKIKCRIL